MARCYCETMMAMFIASARVMSKCCARPASRSAPGGVLPLRHAQRAHLRWPRGRRAGHRAGVGAQSRLELRARLDDERLAKSLRGHAAAAHELADRDAGPAR